jgi:DNA-3-methyladenine glycosylase I
LSSDSTSSEYRYVWDMSELVHVGRDGLVRCPWSNTDDLYVRYHDDEWGVPVSDDRGLFERVFLEGFQSGLSWITILRKRENFREAFAGFDIERVAKYGPEDIQRLMSDAGIIRHKGKIKATINNAQKALDLIAKEGSLAKYFWAWEPIHNRNVSETIPSLTAESDALSRDLKEKEWVWVGPTTMYAFMQAVGIVNDHATDCHSWEHIEEKRNRFIRPL